jgi:uncharacterized protein YndB with AHSA1/START domain
MQLATRAEIEIARSPGEVFDLAASCDGFPRFLHPLGPVPGVAGAEMLDASAPKPGARRRVRMTDGSTMDEELLAFERPTRHRYRWAHPPAPPFSLLVRGGEGDWTFSPAGDGTRIAWDYRFELTTPLVYPLAAVVVLLFRRWMAGGLGRLRTLLTRADAGE